MVCKHPFLLLFLFFLFPATLSAQIDNSFFYDNREADTLKAKSFAAGLEVMGFLRNNEYFNDIVDGYTLFGYQFNPYVRYQPSVFFDISAGVFLIKDFGEEKFTEVAPVLTLRYRNKNVSMLFGNIEGALNHRMIDPLYDYERVITNRLEEGIQVKWETGRVFVDGWIDWENHIFKGDTEQEKFNAGVSSEIKLLNKNNWYAELPLQMIVSHRGGQINTGNDPVVTTMNATAGIETGKYFNRKKAERSVFISVFYTGYNGPENNPSAPFANGSGWLTSLATQSRFFDFYLTWWKGSEYYSPAGAPIYQSVSVDYENNGYVESPRNLLMGRFIFEKEFAGGLGFSFRFEPLYDLGNNSFEHSESVYILYRMEHNFAPRKK